MDDAALKRYGGGVCSSATSCADGGGVSSSVRTGARGCVGLGDAGACGCSTGLGGATGRVGSAVVASTASMSLGGVRGAWVCRLTAVAASECSVSAGVAWRVVRSIGLVSGWR